MASPCTNDPNEVISAVIGVKMAEENFEDELDSAVSTATENADKFDRFVNGTDTQTVQLGEGSPTPTVRNAVRQMMSAAADLPNADVSGKSAISNGGEEARTLADRFADIVNVKDYGAKGDGVTDDTAAIQAVLSGIGQYKCIFFPQGTYLVDELFLTGKANVSIFGRNATLKARTALQRRFFILAISNCTTVEISDLDFDGNRPALRSGYPASVARDWLWGGILVSSNSNNVKILNTSIHDCVANALMTISNVNRLYVDGLYVDNCGKLLNIQGTHDSSIRNVSASNIGNDGLDVYAHACEIRNCTDLEISNFFGYNFKPDANQREPSPGFLTFEFCKNVVLSNISIDTFSGTSISGLYRGISADTVNNLQATGVRVFGYSTAFYLASCCSVNISGIFVDGNFVKNIVNGNNGNAIVIDASGQLGDLAVNTEVDVQETLSIARRSSATSRDVVISNGIIQRTSGWGVWCAGSNVTLTNISFVGVDSGCWVAPQPDSGSFSNFDVKDKPYFIAKNCSFLNVNKNCVYSSSTDSKAIVDSCIFTNYSLGAPFSNLYDYAVFFALGCTSGVVENCTFSKYAPAVNDNVVSWDANSLNGNYLEVSCGFHDVVSIGNKILISDALGSGVDGVFRVVDYNASSQVAKIVPDDGSAPIALDVLSSSHVVSGTATFDGYGQVLSSNDMDFSLIPPGAYVSITISGTVYWRRVIENETGTRIAFNKYIDGAQGASVSSIVYVASSATVLSPATKAICFVGSGDNANPNSFKCNNNTFDSDLTPITYQSSSSVKVEPQTLYSCTVYGKLVTAKTASNATGEIYLGNGVENSSTQGLLLAGFGTANTTGSFYADKIFSGGLGAVADGHVSLGKADKRWSQVFASSGTINTSDAREKDNLEAPSDALMRAWSKVRFKVFQMRDAIEAKGADSARLHVGLIAQDVDEAFASEGLDASRYGFFCYDEWEDVFENVEVMDKPPVYDSQGAEIEPAATHMEKRQIQWAGNRYGIRYEEALALECAYQRWLGEQRDARIADLEARLNEISGNSPAPSGALPDNL